MWNGSPTLSAADLPANPPFAEGAGDFVNAVREARTTRYVRGKTDGDVGMTKARFGKLVIYYLAVPAAVGAVMTVIGPFGTFEAMGDGARALYWFALIIGGWLAVDGCVRFAKRLRPDMPIWLHGALACPPAALLICAGVLGLEAWLRPALDLDWGWLYLRVLVLTGAITAPVTGSRLYQIAEEQPVPAAESGPAVPSSFHRRLPADLGGDLLCLEMEDHYLRVHTTRGNALLLLRLRDAEAELPPSLGRRVHRSWWVARAAVRRPRRDGDRTLLELSDGREVPVGRTYLGALREEGWLE